MLPEWQDQTIELCALLRSKIGATKSDRWFGAQTRLQFSDNRLEVRAATKYLVSFLQTRYADLLKQLSAEVVGSPVSLDWEVDESLAAAPPVTAESDDSTVTKAGYGDHSQSSRSRRAGTRAGRGPFDLGSFVVGDCNRVAYDAASLIASRPLGTTSTMAFFGPVGSGKSHLLEGVAARIRADRSARVMCVKASEFGNQFKQAMAEYSTAAFRQRFNSVEVLCIDDIEFFESKRSFQDELLQTIERLEARGGTVVTTSSVHPKMLTGLSDPLISRLLSGAICRIELPTRELRHSIAVELVKSLEANIRPEALGYIADRFVASVREVVGAVYTLNARAMSVGKAVTLSDARSHLTALERDSVQVVRLADVEAAVAKLFGLQTTEIRSTRRSRSISQPRQVAMYLSRKLTRGAYKEIGDYFGGRNHSTVMAAERNINKMLKNQSTMKIGFQEMPLSEIVARLEDQIRVG